MARSEITGTIAAFSIMLLIAACAACSDSTTKRLGLPPLTTTGRVDLNQYLGKWYEIASFPQWFERGCTATAAEYSLRPDGRISVLNSCRIGSPDGKLKTAKGVARVIDPVTNAKLKVSFFWPFWGDYWVVELGPSYEYAVVGNPGRDYLWILARKPALDDSTYSGILERLRSRGYQVERLVKTVQPADAKSEKAAGN